MRSLGSATGAKKTNNPRQRKGKSQRAGDSAYVESRTIGSIELEAKRKLGALSPSRDAASNESMGRHAQDGRASSVQDGRKSPHGKASRARFKLAGVVLGIAAAAVALFFILANTEAFTIEEIGVEGSDHLTEQEVSALISIPQGTSLLLVDEGSIKQSLMRDAWVEDVEIRREFPHKLVICIQERQIEAVVEIPMKDSQATQNWAIAADGLWLMAIPPRESEIGSKLSEQIYADAENALHIVGVPYGLEPKIGAYCTDDNVNNALEIVSDMTTELSGRVKAVTASDAESTMLTLDNNVEIAFGAATNIRDKERICLKIMEEYPSVIYINVRVPDRPTWRAA